MTKREAKYICMKRWIRFSKRITPNFGLPAGLFINKQDYFKFWCPHVGKIIESASRGQPVTITLSKYNLPNNSNLQKGQLN